nr:hypothetical protein [Bacillus pumilus]
MANFQQRKITEDTGLPLISLKDTSKHFRVHNQQRIGAGHVLRNRSVARLTEYPII